MSKTYDFLNQCGHFIVTTINNAAPAARPFGAVMEYDNELYFSTANTKQVYAQLIANPPIQIIALKPGTREWIRINGRAVEVRDLDIKQAMLDACPVLIRHFGNKECEFYALFKVAGMESLLYTADGVISLD